MYAQYFSCLISLTTSHRTLSIYSERNYIMHTSRQLLGQPINLTLLHRNLFHLYVHISPVHLSTSLGLGCVQLCSSIIFPSALKQVTFLLLSPRPQGLEHYANIKTNWYGFLVRRSLHCIVLCSNGYSKDDYYSFLLTLEFL